MKEPAPLVTWEQYDGTYTDRELMRFALGDERTWLFNPQWPAERCWLRQRGAGLGLVVESPYSAYMEDDSPVELLKPPQWQMSWDAGPAEWNLVCDDCGHVLALLSLSSCSTMSTCATHAGFIRMRRTAVAETPTEVTGTMRMTGEPTCTNCS